MVFGMSNSNFHIGIVGPVFLPSLQGVRVKNNFPKGMGGSPVNHEINALIGLGYKVSVFSLSPELEKNEIFEHQEGRLSIYIGPYRKKGRKRCADLFLKERNFLKLKIREVKPDVLHAHWQYEWGWGAIDSKIPTLLTCHDSPVKILRNQRDIYRFFRLIIAVIVLRKSQYLTTVSPDTKKGLSLFTSKDIQIIPNFLSKSNFNLYTKRFIYESPKIVMINNSFYGLKNVSKGIKAFQYFRLGNSNAELHMFGKEHGPGGAAEQWSQINGLDNNVFFHGEVDSETLLQKVADAHILLHTSLEESFGMVIIEAMALGLPIVAGSKSGAVPWILKDGGGVLVDITSVSDITKGLKMVSSVSRYSKFSIEAHRASKARFEVDKVVGLYLNRLKEIV